MNKPELVTQMAKHCGITKSTAKQVIEYFTDSVSDILKSGEAINISGFGHFRLVTTAPKKYRHPTTGEMMQMDAVKRIKFTPATRLADDVASLDT